MIITAHNWAVYYIAASMDVDFEFSIKCSLTAHLLMVPLCVVLYFCGVVEGGFKEIYVPDGAGGWILDHITYGYGYPHPNALFAAVFIGAVLLLYLNRDRLKLPLLLAVSAVVFLAFWVTECKTGLLVYLALMVALALRAFLPRRRGLLLGYCLLLILGALILGAVLPLIHSEENPLLYFINHYLISGRLHQGKEALIANGISLLGTGGVFLDMLYMDILINSGIVGALMLYLGMGVLVYCYCKDGNDMGMICTAAMILYGCMEQFPLHMIKVEQECKKDGTCVSDNTIYLSLQKSYQEDIGRYRMRLYAPMFALYGLLKRMKES